MWLAGNEPDWTQETDVNGSTQGWGRGNNNFDAGEILRFDFGTLDDYDAQQAPDGPYVPPAASIVNVSFATFTFFNFNDAADQLEFVAHYTNGTTQNFVLHGADNPTSLTITAPSGFNIAWIDAFEQGGSIKLNLATVGVNSTTIDETINATVQLTDGDGDTTSTGAFSIHVATGLAPDAPVLPVVLDLNGDGVHFLGTDAGVHYDYGNGSVATAWAAPDDGILVRDANHNGTVDNASEFVFGSGSVTDLAGARGVRHQPRRTAVFGGCRLRQLRGVAGRQQQRCGRCGRDEFAHRARHHQHLAQFRRHRLQRCWR